MKTIHLRPVLGPFVLATVLCAPVLFGQPAFAQQFFDGEDGFFDDGEGDNPADGLIPGTSNNNPYGILRRLRATPEATDTVTRALRTSYTFCDRVQRPEYLVDCLGVELEVIAKAMSPSGDYAEARVILLEASQKLRKLATENAAPAKPRIRVKGRINSKPVTSRPIKAVRAERVKSVNQQAAQILQEAETKLLRSAQASDRRLIAYAQMAKAVGSNKTLLRSA